MHGHRLRVLYGDTDTAGIVYHANYLRYFEAARGELLREGGLPYSEIERRGYVWPIVETWTRHRWPARYDDLLLVRTWVSELRAASATFAYEIVRESDGAMLCTGATRLACTTRDGHVEAVPGDLRALLAAHLAPDIGRPERRRRG